GAGQEGAHQAAQARPGAERGAAAAEDQPGRGGARAAGRRRGRAARRGAAHGRAGRGAAAFCRTSSRAAWGVMASPRMVKVALVGLGPIGVEIGRALQAREDVTVVAAADPAFAGKRLDELVPGASGVIDKDLAAALSHGVDVAVLATSSRLEGIAA